MSLAPDIVEAARAGRFASLPDERRLMSDAPPPASLLRAQDVARRGLSARRVVFVNRYFFPDVSATSQILSDLARRLAALGLDVHVVCSRQLYDDPTARLPRSERLHGVQVHRAWTSQFGRARLAGRALDYASFYVTGSLILLKRLRRGDIVIAKTDPPLISIAAAGIAKLRGARLINWLQDVFPEVACRLGANPLPGWLSRALTKLRDHSLKVAEMNVVLGGRMLEHLERLRIPGLRLRIIENWADDEAIAPKPPEASVFRRTHALEGKLVVAYSGNLGRAHEFDTLLGAAERLRGDSDIVFVMIGGGVKMAALRTAVQEMRLPNVRFMPYQPRESLADSLAAADIHLACLLPALEGLIVPSKFYGILAAGRPAVFIGDPDGELARVIKRAQCGVVVATGDADALALALMEHKAQPAMRHALGERARALFLSQYTVSRAVKQWLDVIADLGERPALHSASSSVVR